MSLFQNHNPQRTRRYPQLGRRSLDLVPVLRRLSISAATLAIACPVWAQDSEQSVEPGVLEEIHVTGTRIVRDGYEAPTPLTVVDAAALNAGGSPNVADAVNTLPVFSGSQTPTSTTQSVGGGLSGINALNLRNLGPARTLVLVDGQRSVAGSLAGAVDINGIPSQLISRVEVVTGGASAAYGSDALSGVVNFVLDHDFTGFAAEGSMNETTHGDDAGRQGALTFGTPFADDRGHFIISGEIAQSDGILQAKRDWNRQGWGIMLNPAYEDDPSQPERLVLREVGLSTGTPGGMIVDTPLRGTYFGSRGEPRSFNYGDLVSDPNMRGGDWRMSEVRTTLGQSIDQEEKRQNVFTRLSYDLSDNLKIFGQYGWSTVTSLSQCCSHSLDTVISVTNPFLPAEVAQRAQALGLQSLTIGSTHGDLPPVRTDNERTTQRMVAGLSGGFQMLGSDWSWNAYYQRGISEITNSVPQTVHMERYALATDAVRDPATGAIVCRSTLTDPNNGCVPYSVIGVGSNSRAALDYILGTSIREERLQQDVAAITMNGEPFATWAGPVSIAYGIEHRKEQVRGHSDSDSLARNWWIGNYRPTFGKYDVTEGFVEGVVPLARSLELNAAVRLTDYSTSGRVNTWKVGGTFSPIDDVRLRVTRSRDIRAPNLQELFAAGASNQNFVIDPFNNNLTTAYTGLRVGNPDLQPELADTTGIGLVFQPRFAPGLSASVDYWNIDIKDAIDTVTEQEIVDLCFQGNQTFCDAITRGMQNGVNVIETIRLSPFNLVTREARGVDIEASYRLPVLSGNLMLRALATHYLKLRSDNGINTVRDTVGENLTDGPPDWRWTSTISYEAQPLTVGLTARGVSSGVYDNTYIECTSNCPASTVEHRTINRNGIAGAVYFDASVSYALDLGSASDMKVEAFLNVRNLADKDPPPVAPGPGGAAYDNQLANPVLYDVTGRMVRVGVRVRM